MLSYLEGEEPSQEAEAPPDTPNHQSTQKYLEWIRSLTPAQVLEHALEGTL